METTLLNKLAIEPKEQSEVKTLDFPLSPKQLEALSILFSLDIDELLYGGAKGGAKTWLGCVWSYLMCKQIMKYFNLQPTKYPIPVGFMGRKIAENLRTTTLVTWKKVIDPDCYTLFEQKKEIVIENTVCLHFGGLDSSDAQDAKKFNSAEYGFYFIDQAEECTEQDLGLIRGTLRLKIKGQELPYKGLLTANPRICFLKDNFIDNPQPRTAFLQALPSDNPFLPSTYIDTLKKAFGFRPELLKAYLFGNWDDLDTANVIISIKDVKTNVNNNQYDKTIIKKITVCDVAGEGDADSDIKSDEAVIYDFENTKIDRDTVEIYSHRSLMDTCGRIIAHAAKNESNMVVVDVVGEGAGVVSRLREFYVNKGDLEVYAFDGREKADDPLTFANRKIEAWWKASQKFFNKKCDIPDDPILIDQLSKVQYMFRSNGKLTVIPIKELRKLFKGRSPDRATTYIMGLEALERATPRKKQDRYDDDNDDSYNEEYTII